MRHYDLADRTRNRFTAQVDIVPSDAWTFSVVGRHPARTTSATASSACRSRPAARSRSRLISTCRTASARAPPTTTSAMPDCSNRTRAIRQRRSSTIRCATGPPIRPRRSITSRSTQPATHRPQHRGALRLRLQLCRGEIPLHHPGGQPDYRRPISCPNVFNKLQQLHIDVRHRLSGRLAATFSYLYEPLRVYDFAFDPSVVNGIVQPSSLVLGYVYRPYTAHSVVFGLRYFW